MSNTVGSFMRNAKVTAAQFFVTVAAWIVYLAAIVYAEIHGWSMMSKGVNPDFLLWAGLGMVALGVTAVMLPIGLHYSFHSPVQRVVGFAFYFLDLGLLILNAVIDFNITAQGSLPGWAPMYVAWVVPAAPLFAGIGWSLLLMLDPEQVEIAMTESLKQSARLTLARKIEKQAEREDIDAQVELTAGNMAHDIINAVLGQAERRSAPPNVLPVQARDVQLQPPAVERQVQQPPTGSSDVMDPNLMSALFSAFTKWDTERKAAQEAYAKDIAHANAVADVVEAEQNAAPFGEK